MAPFVNWKTQKGQAVEMVAYSAATTGSTSSALKNYVQNYYNTYGLTFLLLVGDADDIPSLYKSGDSDVAYSYVEGNDSYPEFFVGRFSGENTDHIDIQVTRTIAYERDMDASANWLNNGLVIASAEGGTGIGDDNETDKQHMQNIREDLLGYTYTDVTTAYDPGATTTQVSNAFNSGVGNINYIGHGSDLSWVTTGFSVAHANNLTNTDRWPFIFDVACVNGNFHNQTCFAEALIRSEHDGKPAGSVAIIASTINQSWAPPMDGQDEMIDILVESYENNIKRTFAGIAYNGCMHMNDEYGTSGAEMTDTWATFGDPSLIVRTSAPQPMTISHEPEILIGMGILTISCDAEDALVCLSSNGQIMSTASVSNGNAILEFEPFTDVTNADLVITAYNKITYLANLSVIPADGPYLSIQGLAVNDNFGIQNGILDAGEEAFLNLSVKNVGIDNATNVTATLSTNDSFIELIENQYALSTIKAGFTLAANSFKIKVSEQAPNQHSTIFSIVLTDDNGHTWTKDIEMTIHAAMLQLENITFIENGRFGDGNGKLEPGESGYIQMSISNNGMAKAKETSISIASTSPYLSFTDAELLIPEIEAGMFAMVSTTLSTNENTPNGTKAIVLAQWTNNDTTPGINTELIIGQPPVYQIGDGENLASYYPFYNYYKSNKTQMLFLSGEFSSGTQLINQIGLELASFTSNINHRELNNFVVKLSVVSNEQLTDSFIDNANADTVFATESLMLADQTGWFTIPTDTFAYNTANGNLLVEIYWGINSSYCASSDKTTVYCTQTNVPMLAYGYTDNSYPAAYKNVSNMRPNMQFGTVDLNLKQDTATILVHDAELNPLENVSLRVGSLVINSDEQGLVKMYLAHGNYLLWAEKYGYFTVNQDIELNESQNNFTISLNSASLYNLSFTINSGGNALADATLTIDTLSWQSDTQGKIALNEIPEGTYTYSIEKPGYQTQWGSVTLDADAEISLELLAIPTYQVTFNLLSATGTPLENIQVLFNRQSIVSNNLGQTIFTPVPEDSNLVYYVEPTGYYAQSDTIKKLNSDKTIALNLYEIPDLLVQVNDKNGVLKYAKVTFQNESTLTNSEGLARFIDVQQTESESVSIIHAGHYATDSILSISDTDLEIQFYLYEKSDLTLRLTDGTNPIEEALVTLGTQEKYTSVDGMVVFANNDETDNISLTISKDGYVELNKNLSFIKDVDIDTSFVLQQIPDLEIQVLSGETPITDAEITINNQVLITDSVGKIYWVDIPAGTYAYVVSKEGYYTKTGNVTIGSSDIQLTINLSLIPDVTFTITHKGNAESGVKVFLGNLQLLTTGSGVVSFKDVPAGNYHYTITKEGYNAIEGDIDVSLDEINLTFDLSLVGVNIDFYKTIKIYPNPSEGAFIIALPNNNTFKRIEINDQLGRMVFVIDNPLELNPVYLENLAKGIYVISIFGTTETLKFKHLIK
jgi:hypothetical protein